MFKVSFVHSDMYFCISVVPRKRAPGKILSSVKVRDEMGP